MSFGRKDDYAHLPSSGNSPGDAYLVDSDGLVYVYDGGWPAEGNGVSTGGGGEVFCARDVRATGTTGGNSVAGSQRRVLNTVAYNTIFGAALASNMITLPKGVYSAVASAPIYRGSRHKIYLYNETSSSILLVGSSEFSDTTVYVQSTSHLAGAFQLSTSSTLSLMHFVQVAFSNGCGIQSDAPGISEVYAQIMITKLA